MTIGYSRFFIKRKASICKTLEYRKFNFDTSIDVGLLEAWPDEKKIFIYKKSFCFFGKVLSPNYVFFVFPKTQLFV